MNSVMPSEAYSSIRPATFSWLPTRAVPAPPRTRPTLAHRLAGAEDPLRLGDLGRVDVVEQPAGLGPGVLLGVPGDHVQPDAEAQRAALGRGQLADPAQLLGHLGRRLTPGQVDVRVLGGDRAGRGRRAAEVDAGQRVRRAQHGRPIDLVVLAVEVERLAAPRTADDGQELRGPRITLVVRQVVAEPALFVGLAAGDHVEQQPAAGQPLVGGRHLGGQRRRGQPGPERDQELQPPRLPGECGGDQPGVLAPGPGRGEHGLEAKLLGGAGHLGQVLDVRRPFLRRGPADVQGVRDAARAWLAGLAGRGQAVPPAHDRAAVAGGGQEPVEGQAHQDVPPAVLLNAVSTNLLKSTWPGISPAVVNALETCCSDPTTAGVIGTARAASSLAALAMMASVSPVALAHTAAQAAWWVAAQACAWASSLR